MPFIFFLRNVFSFLFCCCVFVVSALVGVLVVCFKKGKC